MSGQIKFHQANVPYSGIAYGHQGSRTIGEVVKTLALIWEWVDTEDMVGQIEFIKSTCVRGLSLALQALVFWNGFAIGSA